jgi:hypothetical protein
MSSLADVLKEAKAAALKPKPSKYEQWVDQLDESDRVALLAAVAASELPIRVLHEVVTSKGAPIGRDRFAVWLRANGYER